MAGPAYSVIRECQTPQELVSYIKAGWVYLGTEEKTLKKWADDRGQKVRVHKIGWPSDATPVEPS